MQHTRGKLTKQNKLQEDTCMKFYDETRPLCIEMDASGVGLGAALLKARRNTNCPKDEAPDNSILRPTAFASKILIEMEQR